ncbi:MAG: beta-glucosidase BglX [Prevotella sp.]|nr:beta-glucosidase BglX [Prevotella sp.]
MRKTFLTIALLATGLLTRAQGTMDSFVSQLMSKMTLEEKIGQLNLLPGDDITTGSAVNSPLGTLAAKGQLGAILNVKGQDKIRALQEVAVKKSRLGIPLLFGQDVIHGNQTVFPIPLAQSCSWDIPAIKQGARIAAREATAQGINWVYSPMVDIAVDPRWGRIAEGNGEDPFLGSRIAEALIRGYQGSYGKENAMACVKHFALYGAAEAGRDYNTVDMSRVRMYNQYLPPYKAAAEAGAGSFMSSFNVVDGIPATANRWLLTDLLRKDWRYDGFVVTDYGSINEMTQHRIGEQDVCAALALTAGTDMDMCSSAFTAHLEKCLKEGTVTMADIDTACRRVLEAKYKLGLFKDPYRFCEPKRLKTDLYTEANRKAARDFTAETFVLLKNEGNLLPLKKEGKIALIGPLVDNRNNLPGCWSTGDTPEKYTTLKEAMLHAVDGKATIMTAPGCNIYADAATQLAGSFNRPIDRVDDAQAKAEALRIAREADVIVAALGELAEMSGESASRANLTLPDVQMDLLKALVATGKPVVLLNHSGRPTILKWESEHVAAILNVWFGGSESADATCDILFGDKTPSGKLTTTFPQTMGQIPLYYNHLSTGRPVPDGAKEFRKFQSNYIDVRNDALYPFGYGLSYTTFNYSDITLSAPTMAKDGSVTATVTVTNTGSRDADEVVQLYIRDCFASIARPVKELKGFQRIHLAAGESKPVTFTITPDLLKFYDSSLNFVLEPGDFDIMAGPNSQQVSAARLKVR